MKAPLRTRQADVPEEWSKKPLRELAAFEKGHVVATQPNASEGCVAYIGAESFGGIFSQFTSDKSATTCEPTDVLMLWDGERSGLCASGLRGAIGSTVARLRPRDGVNGRFLYYQLARHFHWVQARRTGTGVPHVPKDIGTVLHVPIPKAETEQARIARVLDTVDELIAKTEAVIGKLRQVRAGLLHDLLTRGLDAHGQLRPPPAQAPHLYQPSPLGQIPKEWEVVNVSELGKIVTGATPPSSASGSWGHQLPFVTPVELSDDGTILPPERYLSKAGCLYVRELPAGSVLVVCIGSTLGKIGVAPWSCATNQQINAVVCSSEHEPAFVASMLSRHIRQLHRWAGLQAVPIVNKSQFGRMLIPVSASGEQKRIVRVLSELDWKVSVEVDLNAKLHHLKSGLMDDLLTGRVRVPPDLENKLARQPDVSE